MELNSKGLHQSSGKEKESCCLLFPSSTKREIRQFHVVVVQRRQRNVQKSVMHVQSCCFACVNLLLFCRSRCRRRRRCINSLVAVITWTRMLDGKARGCSQWFLSHRSVASGLEKLLHARSQANLYQAKKSGINLKRIWYQPYTSSFVN